MKHSFVVGRVAFETRGDALVYWPTVAARTYQSVAAIGIALGSAFFAFVFARNKPLVGLFDGGEAWNTATVLAFALLAIVLVGAVPLYLRRAAAPYAIEAAGRCLRKGTQLVRDLSRAGAISLEFHSGSAGEYSSVPTWSVVSSEGGKIHFLPLLTFEQHEEARRVAAAVAEVLSLSVV